MLLVLIESEAQFAKRNVLTHSALIPLRVDLISFAGRAGKLLIVFGLGAAYADSDTGHGGLHLGLLFLLLGLLG